MTRWGQGRGGRPWRRLRDAVLLRDKYLCQCAECAERLVPLEATEVDHIVPIAKGGKDEGSNLRAINTDCHKRKTLRESGVNVKLSRAERRERAGDHWSR